MGMVLSQGDKFLHTRIQNKKAPAHGRGFSYSRENSELLEVNAVEDVTSEWVNLEVFYVN
ncbi:hypothetical protein PsAD5_03716 [Pseudovibrio sp. Ad5]|nr:hypothetical protein PsAD5_03716 [Pseudovibrio sp. Ad5]